jgi:tetratricopeptide (TPR) repeat protein
MRLSKVHADDSEGEFGWASQRAADLHARACAQALLDEIGARKLGRWLARFRANSPGWPETTLAMYAPALGGAGIKAYRAAVTKLAATARSYEVDEMLLELADHDGDVDEAVRLLASRDPISYAAIIDRLTAAGRSAEALDWLDRAVAADRLPRHTAGASPFWISPADAVERYLAAGRPQSALDVARRAFSRDIGPETMRFVVDVARRVGVEDAEHTWAMTAAEAQAARRNDGAELALVALADGDLIAAWSAVERFGAGRAWRALAEASANDLPVAAADLYRPELDRLLLTPNTQNYPEVAKILVTMRRLYTRVGEEATIDAFAELREKYERRPSLMSALDPARLP